MENFVRKEFRALTRGINCAQPPDTIDPTQYPLLVNVCSPIEGSIRQRDGMTLINPAAIADLSIHSITRLNDYLNGIYARFLGAGTHLYGDNLAHNAFAQIDSGYAGKPLTFVGLRPPQSPKPWVYIGDGNHLRRTSVDEVVQNMGVAPPRLSPNAQVA